jgi:hypothetical protein
MTAKSSMLVSQKNRYILSTIQQIIKRTMHWQCLLSIDLHQLLLFSWGFIKRVNLSFIRLFYWRSLLSLMDVVYLAIKSVVLCLDCSLKPCARYLNNWFDFLDSSFFMVEEIFVAEYFFVRGVCSFKWWIIGLIELPLIWSFSSAFFYSIREA